MDTRRRAPTPAAVLTCVALGTAAATYALVSWNDALDQADAGQWAWPLDPTTTVRLSTSWALAVTLVCAVVLVAVSRRPDRGRTWLLAGAVAVAVVGWCAAAWRGTLVAFRADGWYVPWPGPVAATAYVNDPTDPLAAPLLAPRPGLLTPVVLLAAVAVSAWAGRRTAPRDPGPATRPAARATALSILGAPILAAVVGGTLLQLQPDDYLTAVQRAVAGAVAPGAALTAAVVAALALAGTGRTGWVLLTLVDLAVVGPLVWTWWLGGPDSLLGTAALGTLAIAMAAAVRPVALAVSRLGPDRSGDEVLGTSVAERPHADDRARA